MESSEFQREGMPILSACRQYQTVQSLAILHPNVHPPFVTFIPQTTCQFSFRTKTFSSQANIAKKVLSEDYSSIIPHLRYFIPNEDLNCPVPAVTTLKARALGSSVCLDSPSLSHLLPLLFCLLSVSSSQQRQATENNTRYFPALPLHTFHAPR